MKYLAIIQLGENQSLVYWCKTKKAVDERLALWMRENPKADFYRMTIAECLWTIEN